MEDDLVTVATFSDLAESNIARNLLETNAIPAFLADEATVGMAWYLTVAVGGVKLQVSSSNVDAALKLLREAKNADVDSAWHIVDESAEGPEQNEASENESDIAPSSRELNADRAYRGAVLGFLLLPLQLYVFWLLIKVFVSNESIGRRYRRHVLIAAAINLPLMFLFCVILREILTPN